MSYRCVAPKLGLADDSTQNRPGLQALLAACGTNIARSGRLRCPNPAARSIRAGILPGHIGRLASDEISVPETSKWIHDLHRRFHRVIFSTSSGRTSNVFSFQIALRVLLDAMNEVTQSQRLTSIRRERNLGNILEVDDCCIIGCRRERVSNEDVQRTIAE